MRAFFVLLIFASFLWSMEDCKSCHNVETFDKKNHNFSCKTCHVPANIPNPTHDDVIANPTEDKYVYIFCALCHEKRISTCKQSSHFTHKNEIKTILHAFNIDGDYTIKNLPSPKKINSKEDMVYDLLRRKCLKCHMDNERFYESGSAHGKGCMACHGKYASDGKYKGTDEIVKGESPHAKTHKLIKKPPMSACLSCHNKEFIGTDYLGMFPKNKDTSNSDSKSMPNIFGANYHYLSQDVHFAKSITCVDCHGYTNTFKDKKVSCKKCHKYKKNEAHQKYHENISCETCHASWGMNNYELSLTLDKSRDYKKWYNKDVLEDGFVKNFLDYTKHHEIEPTMPDFVSGKIKKGIWYASWKTRRWENILLGNDENGKIKIMRPMFQYHLTYINEKGKKIFDDLHTDKNGSKFEVFIPYTPHTIGKKAKSCESCHENPFILNKIKTSTPMLESLNGRFYKATPLSKKQIDKLSSQKYKDARAKMLKKDKKRKNKK